MYRLARRLVSQPDDALDLVQEAFLRAARRPHAVPAGPRAEEAWLVRVLVNIRRDQWRKEAIRRQHQRELTPPSATRHAEGALIDRAVVWSALDGLAPRRRAVLVMHELDGLSIGNIASLLGIAAVTVRWHLSRGRRELGRSLGAESGEPHEHTDKPLAQRRSGPSRSTAL
jgi:RNA polymerase sigma-70 factor (ECF subfamily)